MSDVLPAIDPTAADPVRDGLDALGRHAWPEAYELLSQADRDGRLSGTDLEGLALAAFFTARGDQAMEVKERAFKLHQTDENLLRAGFVAVDIARNYGYAGKQSIASAWRRRAEQVLGTDGDTYAHGYLALALSEAAAGSGDLDAALALAERAVAVGQQTADADLKAFAQTNLGGLKIAMGSTSDGFALMEEASIAAVSGELTPFTSGVTACRMIGACRDLTDYRRASEWIEATEKYCDRQSLEGFPGVCRIHRAEVAVVGGAWERAETELERATVELGAYNTTPPQADGFYALGDIRRLKGDFVGAEAALREAHSRGRTPQPALALIRLAQGNVKAAVAAIDSAVAEVTWDRWARARLLPAQVEIAIAAGDVVRARVAADELVTIISSYPSPALEAGCRLATGRVLAAEGDAAAAARELRLAITGWRDVGAPYEVARSRTVLSRALRTIGDEENADLELTAALDEFRRLGARIDVEAAERELRDATDRRNGPGAARPPDVHVHGYRRLDQPGRGARRPGLGTAPALARRDAARARRAGWGTDRQLDRRWVLRGVRVGPRCRRHRDRDPEGASRAPGDHGFRVVGQDRPACRRGDPPRRRLQRNGGPRRGEDRSAGHGWRDPGVGADGDRGGRHPDVERARGDGQGRIGAGGRGLDHLGLSTPLAEPRFTMVVLLIDDLPRSLAFYRRLGVQFPPDADRKTDVQLPLGGDHQLVLTTTFVRNDPDRHPPSGGSRIVLEFFVDGNDAVDAKFAELTAAGYRGRREPWLTSFDAYMCMVDDPDGNTVLVTAG